MDEFDELEDVYFEKKRIKDVKEEAKMKGLYWYCWFTKPPKNPTIHVPYNLLTCLAKVAPKGSEINFILEKLQGYGYLKEQASQDLKDRITYALNWVEDFKEVSEVSIELSASEKTAIKQIIKVLETVDEAEKIQSAVFEIARANGMQPKKFFEILYLILIGTPSGPRLGSYIIDIGRENAVKALARSLQV